MAEWKRSELDQRGFIIAYLKMWRLMVIATQMLTPSFHGLQFPAVVGENLQQTKMGLADKPMKL